MGAVIGLDFGAIWPVATALGCPPVWIAELLPAVESGMMAALAERAQEDTSSEH